MKERGVLFSGEMVKAILAGTKTQTRRIANMAKIEAFCRKHYGADFDAHAWAAGANPHLLCPYGDPVSGDRLWVRETWRPFMEAWRSGIEYAADGGCMNLTSEHADALAKFSKIALRFPGARKDRHSEAWHPSIHLPRRFSRITLDVLSVRVEPLHDISEADARAEGVAELGPRGKLQDHRGAFVALWESINGAESWAANPWVWRIEFRRTA